MEKFNLKQRTISEILEENISENQTVTYAFNYEYNEAPKSISFYLTDNNDTSVKLLIGSYYAQTGQIDLKTVQEIENIGQLIDEIKTSIQEIINLYTIKDAS